VCNNNNSTCNRVTANILCYFLCHICYHKDLLQLAACMVCVDSRQPANNKAGCMGHILQHSRVGLMLHVFRQFRSFLLFYSFCLFLSLFSGCICIYVCVLNCMSGCHYGVIKHNNNNIQVNRCQLSPHVRAVSLPAYLRHSKF